MTLQIFFFNLTDLSARWAGTQNGEIFFGLIFFPYLSCFVCWISSKTAGSAPSFGAQTGRTSQVQAMTAPSSYGTQAPATACRRWPGTYARKIFFKKSYSYFFLRILFLCRRWPGTQIGEIFFFSILSSNFLPLPVLTHLIAIAVSCLWHGARTAEH